MKKLQVIAFVLIITALLTSACSTNVIPSTTPASETPTNYSPTPINNPVYSNPPTTYTPKTYSTVSPVKPSATTTIVRPTTTAPPTSSSPKISPTPYLTSTIPTTAAKTTTTVPPTTANIGQTATVSKIIDGDTIEVLIGGSTYTVRYIGIDTPEIAYSDPYSQEATVYNTSLVSGKTVKLEKDTSETDKYGRLLRYVYSGDIFVNAELVRTGLAMPFEVMPDIKFAGLFKSMEAQAITKKVGLYSSLVGSKKASTYHLPACEWAKKINPENEIWFTSLQDADSHNYKPCSVCIPK